MGIALKDHSGIPRAGKTGSNPSLSAFNELIVSKLQNLTDDISDKDCQPMENRFTLPKVYEPKSKDGDWFVWFNYRHPKTGAYSRIKIFRGFNNFSTKSEKRKWGADLCLVLRSMLKEGISPFDSQVPEMADSDKSVVFMIDRYLSKLDVKPSTAKKYRIELTLFKKWLIRNNIGDRTLSEINKTIVTNFLEHYKTERSWSGKTYNHYLNDITTFFNYFYDNFDDIITKVPTRSLKRKAIDRPGNSAFTDFQLARLKELMLSNGDHLLYTFCSFIYYAALRNIAEARNIKVGDFNFKTNTLRIGSGTAKNRRTEFIPIYPEFLELLYELGIDKMDPNLYVFGKVENKLSLDIDKFQVGAPYPTGIYFFGRRFNVYKNKYGSELGLSDRDGIYCYKHTRAVHLGEDGEDLYKIMKLFRHRDLATTMIYMRDLGINTQGSDYTKGRSF